MSLLGLWCEFWSRGNDARVQDHYELYREKWSVWFIPFSVKNNV